MLTARDVIMLGIGLAVGYVLGGPDDSEEDDEPHRRVRPPPRPIPHAYYPVQAVAGWRESEF